MWDFDAQTLEVFACTVLAWTAFTFDAFFDTPTFRTREATWVPLTQRGSNTAAHFEATKRLSVLSFHILPCVPCIAWPSICLRTCHRNLYSPFHLL